MTVATGIDIETTGLDVYSGHKIIEIALVSYDIETANKLREVSLRFNPRRNIDAKAQAVHGISLEMLADSPLFEDKAASLAKALAAADVWVAHNGRQFDIPFITKQMRDCGVELIQRPLIDTMDARWACESGKIPRLQELAVAMGFVYDEEKAHGALYDTQLLMQCFMKARKDYGFFKIEGVC
ncbi:MULTISPECIES: 3'-5' exonuclease [Klebsiella pneumoniae complex]|uniref:3'-5' exonuclease n=1 Tax=Klebsiella pneumoniae complex TaxID=3390273 RepID=UPI0021D8A115|nr:3'-5' exonuclease [Klebsiella quasipneumoniae]MCU8815516.1 3'-5' exonuclease [Klebsiella quasipneumoniae]